MACGCSTVDALGTESDVFDQGQSYDSEGGWMDTNPHICTWEGSVVVEFGRCKAYWFDPPADPDSDYEPQNVQTLDLKFEDCKFTFADCNGDTWIFDEMGIFVSTTSAGGTTTQVISTTEDGQPEEIQTEFPGDGGSGDGGSKTESRQYKYKSRNSMLARAAASLTAGLPLLIEVTLRRREGDGPWCNLRRVVYTYYEDGDSGGSDGDLKTATTQMLCGADWVNLDTQYFRYYLEGDSLGFAHALKYVLQPAAFARMSETADPLTASDSLLAQFADRYYEYDSESQRVTKLVTNAGLLTYLYSATISENTDDFNHWKTKSVTTRPDGSTVTEYFNFADALMLRELSLGGDSWVDYYHFNAQGLEDQMAMPSAVISYDDGQPDLDVDLQSSAGLIRTTTYYSSTTATSTVPGGVAGYVESTAIQEGTGGTPIPQSLVSYIASPGGSAPTVYPVAERTMYRNDDGTGEIVTRYGYEWYPDTAQVLQRITLLPPIPADQNGPDDAPALHTDLVHWWGLHEESGTRRDSAGTDDLADHNGVGSGSGLVGVRATFDGTQWLSVDNDTSLRIIGDTTFALWVNFATLTTPGSVANSQLMLGKWSVSSGHDYIVAYNYIQGTPHRFEFTAWDSVANAQFTVYSSLGPATIDTWYFLVCQYDSSSGTIGISINGGAFDTISIGTPGTSSNPLLVGADHGPPYNKLIGSMQLVGKWNRLLTSGEVAELYNDGDGLDLFPNSAIEVERYDLSGRTIWSRDARGFINHVTYDAVTGAMTRQIADVNGDLVTLPSGWSTPVGGGLNLVTDFESDDQGRTTQTLGPVYNVNGETVRTASWTVYDDIGKRTYSAQGFATGIAPTYVYTLVNPVTIQTQAADGLSSETIQAVRSCGTCNTGRLTAADCFPQSSWVAWSRQISNGFGQLVASRAYHSIPQPCIPVSQCSPASPTAEHGCTDAAINEGSLNTNYYETTFGHDVMNRQNRVVTPGGTITRTVVDVRGLTLSTYVGTNDAGATDGDPTGGGAPGNNMAATTIHEYDGGADSGNGNLTQRTLPVNDDPGNDRVTSFEYDFRHRRVAIDGEIDFYQQNFYDNLNHVIQVDRRDTSSGGNLIARSETLYDDRERVYRTIRYGVDPSTGTVGNALTDNNWYDAGGNAIKRLPAGSQLFTKSMFDGVGRPFARYQGYFTGEGTEPYIDVGRITEDNKIFEQTLTTYDGASNAVLVASYQRFHDATGNGPLNLPDSVTQPLARVSYACAWFDGIGRQAANANYGTNDNVPLVRPDTVPTRGDGVLVTTLGYDQVGNPFQRIDPAGKETRQTFDALQRPVTTIANYTGGCAGNASDVTVARTYNGDNNLLALTAKNPTTGDQTTRYIYGTTLDDSDIASNQLLRQTIYPDSTDDTDRVTHAYNRQGEITQTTDQNGTVHDYVRDLLGRPTDDRVTTLGSGIDGAVQRISKTYEVRGLVETVTSFDDPASGSEVNQIKSSYNGFGQLAREYQEHAGAVTTSTLCVDYGYADGSANTVRPTSITYPNGRELTYAYAAGDDDAISRITSIDDAGPETRVSYTYLGLGTFIRADYPEPTIRWDLITGSGANPYAGLDRFGRVIDCFWHYFGGTPADVERIQYAYDRASNRIWRHNTVASDGGNDELYSYDGLQRLIDMSRGDLVDSNAAINNQSFAQQWRLDATGNWSGFLNTDVVTPASNLDQQRTSNQVNEITEIVRRYGLSWAQPVYDRAGNMTAIPQPATPTDAFAGSFDAWNRLVALAGVATYSYDGTNRRTTKTIGGDIRHFYYSNQWQVLEERLNASVTPDRHFIWGIRYIDDLVLRERSTTGPLSERLYALQDDNWNVTATNDVSGSVQERYRYDAYGQPTVLDTNFNPRSDNDSIIDWETRYAGTRFELESNLYNGRSREYNPIVGVWTAQDQFIVRQQIDATRLGDLNTITNLYQYGQSSPLASVDPSGAVVFSVTPLTSTGMPWRDERLPGKSYGVTRVSPRLKCLCIQCCDLQLADANILLEFFNEKYYLKCFINAKFTIVLDVKKIMAASIWLYGVYGHEQRHVESWLSFLRRQKAIAERAEVRNRCNVTFSQCDKAKTAVERDFAGEFDGYATWESHDFYTPRPRGFISGQNPLTPLPFQVYDPIGEMPLEPRP